MENGVADLVGGCARFEAATVGELGRGEVAQCPAGDHTNLWLDGVLLGEGDGLPVMVGEDERAIFAQDFASERGRYLETSHRGGAHDTSDQGVIYTYSLEYFVPPEVHK